MKLNLEELSKVLKGKLYKNEQYQETLYLTKLNASGKIWLFGGALYKTLINQLYNKKIFTKDFDFLVEKINKKIILTQNWKRIHGKFTNPKFQQIKGRLELDIVALNNVHYLKENSLKPNITNFLDVAPLNIFSLVYDLNSEKLIGSIGKQALEKKIIRVHNLGSAKTMAKMYNTTIKNMIAQKAEELNFKAEYP